jgi:predicted YcjX-like family ATPase
MATKLDGVWMDDESRCISLSRRIAEEAMRAARLDVADFRLRDAIIGAINKTVEGVMDSAVDQSIYKRAFDNMAEQMLCPKMTGLEMAKSQLGEK